MPNFNLLTSPWIPMKRQSRRIQWEAPANLTRELAEDPVVAIEWGRPDFNGACLEFLIGVLTAAMAPDDDDAWADFFQEAPTDSVLAAQINTLADFFNFDSGPLRVFQDAAPSELGEADIRPPEALLLDWAGEQAISNNSDHFGPGRLQKLGRPAAAMALITAQTYSSAGGAGYRTSLRGGGPLTTLVDPRLSSEGRAADEAPLWRKLWANVETKEQLAARGDVVRPVTSAFPWLIPTRTSARGQHHPIGPADSHPLEAYFAAPRRIALVYGGHGVCDLTRQPDDVTVIGFRTRNYGNNYKGWIHPLSPHYRKNPAEEWQPVHAQPGGLGWKDWLGLTVSGDAASALRRPAPTVAQFRRRALLVNQKYYRIHAFGFDFDQAKARGWIEAVMPVFVIANAEVRALLEATVAQALRATELVASALSFAVREALFENPSDVPAEFGGVRRSLWQATENDFYHMIEQLANSSEDEVVQRRAAFLMEFQRLLQDEALRLFDLQVSSAAVEPEHLKREIQARHRLGLTLSGVGTAGRQLYDALGLTQSAAPARRPRNFRRPAA